MSNVKILLIDDDKSTRSMFAIALEDTGYILDLAEDEEQGVKQFEEDSYKVIFLDINMPKYNGLVVLKMLQAIKDVNVQFIFLAPILRSI